MRRLTDGKRMLLCDYQPDSDGMGLLDLAGARFTEPFFVQSVTARLQDSPRALELAGDRQEILSEFGGESLPLRGMIFHTGRCGSTLLCNALSAADSVMVLKEPLFLSSISVAAAGLTGGTLAERTGSLISRGLGPTRPQQTGLVLKFTSWNILASDFWNTVAPGCPRIFIWRPCAEVMESILAAPAGWATGVERSLALSALEAGLAAVTSGALHGLSVPMKTAMAAWLSAAARGRELGKAGALVIPYAAIQHDFPGVLDRVLQHMGITLSPDSLARAISVRKIYAKDPSGTLAFTPARPRRGLPADLRPVIETTAHELEVALTALGDRPDRSREG